MAIVVHVARAVFSLGLFVIHNPVLVIYHVLVVVFLTNFQMKRDEPLVCELIVLHVVAGSPGVHRATQLHHAVPWASVV